MGRQRHRHRQRRSVHRGLRSAADPPEFDAPEVELVLSTYEITTEPIDDPYARRLSGSDHERIKNVGAGVQDHPEKHVKEAEQLVQEYPDIPMVYNFLAAACEAAGKSQKARQVIEETYRRFPDYLFGLINYASYRIMEGHPEEVPGILKHKLALDHVMPHRRRFHITEFAAFHALLVRYLWALGEMDAARQNYRLLRTFAPDEPATRSVKALVRPFSLTSLLSRMLVQHRRRTPG